MLNPVLTPYSVCIVYQVPFDHNVRDTVSQDTPLMVAALCGNEAALDFLLQSAIYHTYDVFPNCGKEYVLSSKLFQFIIELA